MKPYYQDGGITIYHGDCREILPRINAESINVVLTDPPFFMPATHYQSRIDWQRSWSDTTMLAAFWATVLDMCIPLLRFTGHLLTFCNGDSYPVFYPEILKCLVWDKRNVGLGRVWRNQHELVIAARWNESKFLEDTDLRADIFAFTASPSSERQHPVEKPASMLTWLLKPLATQGHTVLDPFCGSGTTLEAARKLGAIAIGIEGEERYCEIAAKRLSQEVFDFAPPPLAPTAEQPLLLELSA